MTYPLRARVLAGRLVLDEPTELPEGSVVELIPVDEADDMDDEERARFDEALVRSLEQVQRGELVDADVVIAKLRARG